MEIRDQVLGQIRESAAIKDRLATQALDEIAAIASAVLECLKSGGKLIAFGNGGSAADAQHLVAELVGRYRLERQSLPAIALTSNSSSVTAIANDYGFEEVFARQVRALAKSEDVVLAISTSGNSPSVLRGILAAKQIGALTVGLTGQNGGQLRELVYLKLCVPSCSTPRIQEIHILVAHIISEIIDTYFVTAAQSDFANDVRSSEGL